MFIFVIVLFLLLGLICILTSIVKKRIKLLIIGILLISVSFVGSFFVFLEHTIEIRKIDREHLSFSESIELVTEELQHPYDPCLKTKDMDGPIYVSEKKTLRHLLYDDFALIYASDFEIDLFPLTNVKFPEYFFSISRAAYAIREQVIGEKPSKNNLWMIQLTDISEVDSKFLFNFVIGEGSLDLACPHYFKIAKHASVSTLGEIYQEKEKKLQLTGRIQDKVIETLTPDREFGVDMLKLFNTMEKQSPQ